MREQTVTVFALYLLSYSPWWKRRQFGYVAINKILLGPEPEDSGLLDYLPLVLDLPVERVDLARTLAFDPGALPDSRGEWQHFHLIGASLRQSPKAP